MLRHSSCLLYSILVIRRLFMSRHNSGIFFQKLLKQCCDKKESIVVTLFYLLQHFLFNPSQIMSRQSCEVSRQSLSLYLELNFIFVVTYIVCCDIDLLVALSFCCDILRLCRDILKLCCDISTLVNFYYFSHWICFFYIQNL